MDRGAISRVWLPLIAGALAVTAIFTRGPGPHGTVRWVGLALAVIGLGGVILARMTLGQSFSIAAKARALVTTGIYSKIRNPIYVSGMIYLIGMAIMIGQPSVLAFLVIVIPMQIWRAKKEARVLEEKFGEEYRAYRRRTWF